MDDDTFIYLKSRINQEGFDYCFMKYSNFKEIEDPHFHKLRLEYIEAHKRLQAYVNEKAEDEFYGE